MAAPLGAVIEDIDVSAIDDKIWRELDALFVEHHVLVFPGQRLTPDQHISFASRWGEPVSHPYAAMPDHPEIIELKNAGRRRDVNQHWHSDMTYNAAPPKLTMLYALEAPEFGGDTAFSNQELAYDGLSDGLKAMVDSLSGHHTAAGLARLYKEDPGSAPRADHPLVRTHDQSGRRSLYLCRAFTSRFVGWTERESSSLMEYLFEQSVRPEYQARHAWTAGDLVMWDNRCLVHFAVHDHDDDPRTIHRTQVQGPVPA
jgi:taurine dioxygenase